MNIKIPLLIVLALLLKTDTSAQQIGLMTFEKYKTEKDKFKTQDFDSVLFLKNETQASCVILFSSFTESKLTSIPQGYYYDAFFCKLETRVRKSANIWIKMRLGDFEDYEK